MEPRPQRPRSVGGHPPAGNATAAGAAPAGYPPEGVDPTTFIAPPRTEYDYSPLDLSPPGQRRRRQIVAAAVGLLTLLLLGAVGVFAYLLVRDTEPEGRGGLAASQTEIARDGATVAAQQTLVAEAAAQETAAAGGGPASPDAATAESSPGQGEQADRTPTDDEATQGATEPRVATGSGSGSGDDGAPTSEELVELLPDESLMPEGLTASEDNERSFEDVVSALGGGPDNPDVEQNLEEWGWSANVERTFSAPNPEELAPDATTVLLVSIHGFESEDAASDALTFYADTLAATGQEEGEAPNLGDSARLLQTVDGDGATIVSLYVQEGNVVYRIVGISPGGDPTSVVNDVADQLLERNAE